MNEVSHMKTSCLVHRSLVTYLPNQGVPNLGSGGLSGFTVTWLGWSSTKTVLLLIQKLLVDFNDLFFIFLVRIRAIRVWPKTNPLTDMKYLIVPAKKIKVCRLRKGFLTVTPSSQLSTEGPTSENRLESGRLSLPVTGPVSHKNRTLPKDLRDTQHGRIHQGDPPGGW